MEPMSQKQKNDILEAMLSVDADESDKNGQSIDPDDVMPQLASMFSTPRSPQHKPSPAKVPAINVHHVRDSPKKQQMRQDEAVLRQLVIEIEKIIDMREAASPFEVQRPYRLDSVLPKPRNLSEMTLTQRQIASQERRTGMLISNL